MFFYLSKTVYFLMMPLGWIIVAFVLSIFLKNQRWKLRLRKLGFILLIFFTNPFLANEFLGWWEYKPVPLKDINGSYDLAIVLTGVSDNVREPQDRVYFNKGADRVTHTVQLFKMGKINRILLAGGSGAFKDPTITEADNLKRAMVLMGVPDSVIMVENTSRNTRQSAVNTAAMLSSEQYSRIVLITSSFHMRRAKACFDKVGLETEQFPADFYASKRNWMPNAWIPNPGALTKWSVLFHEIIGLIAYKVMGYA